MLQQQWVAIWHGGSANLLREAISRIDALYREAKRREAAIDFAGLEEETIRLLENDPGIRRERTSSRFDQILMDELQDTNALQWRLVGLIRRSLFAVGDINQSIYGFRHADPAVFAKYRDSLMEAGAPVDDLRENHRSVSEILGAVSRVLDGQKGIEPRPLIASRCADGESVGPTGSSFWWAMSARPPGLIKKESTRKKSRRAWSRRAFGNSARITGAAELHSKTSRY